MAKGKIRVIEFDNEKALVEYLSLGSNNNKNKRVVVRPNNKPKKQNNSNAISKLESELNGHVERRVLLVHQYKECLAKMSKGINVDRDAARLKEEMSQCVIKADTSAGKLLRIGTAKARNIVLRYIDNEIKRTNNNINTSNRGIRLVNNGTHHLRNSKGQRENSTNILDNYKDSKMKRLSKLQKWRESIVRD